MIKLENITKKYIVSHEKQALVRNIFPVFLRINKHKEFLALRNIGLEVDSNRSIGIIGRNGSGKTTLLNIISGITVPTTGRMIVKGKIATLLTLGAGFHLELTGEENIYLNGSILGMTRKQIRNRLESIVNFCQLNNFIDAPLRTYSSGMQMRLGFAIAIHTDFDILLIDEILSVGDIAFQQKCLDKMNDFRRQGKTILLVSQSLDLIKQFCDEVILMENGSIIQRGVASDLIRDYQKMMNVKSKEVETDKIKDDSVVSSKNDYKIDRSIKLEDPVFNNKNNHPPTMVSLNNNNESIAISTFDVQITKVRFIDSTGIEKTAFKTGEKMKVLVDYRVNKEIFDPHFGVAIFRDNGIYCFGPNTRFDGLDIGKLKKGQGQFCLEYKSLNLLTGKYLVSVAIWEKDEKFAYDCHYARYSFEVVSDKKDHGICFIEHEWSWSLPK